MDLNYRYKRNDNIAIEKELEIKQHGGRYRNALHARHSYDLTGSDNKFRSTLMGADSVRNNQNLIKE